MQPDVSCCKTCTTVLQPQYIFRTCISIVHVHICANIALIFLNTKAEFGKHKNGIRLFQVLNALKIKSILCVVMINQLFPIPCIAPKTTRFNAGKKHAERDHSVQVSKVKGLTPSEFRLQSIQFSLILTFLQLLTFILHFGVLKISETTKYCEII